MDEWRLHEVVSCMLSEFICFCLYKKELGTVLYGGSVNGWIRSSLYTGLPLGLYIVNVCLYAVVAVGRLYGRVELNISVDQVCRFYFVSESALCNKSQNPSFKCA
jgi:hypothetical protein